MPLFGPGIGEIQVDPIDFAGGKYVCDTVSVHADQAQIRKLKLVLLLDGAHKYAGKFLNSDIIDIRMLGGQRSQKLPLAHADFDMERSLTSEHFLPTDLPHFRFRNGKGAGVDGFPRAGNIF